MRLNLRKSPSSPSEVTTPPLLCFAARLKDRMQIEASGEIVDGNPILHFPDFFPSPQDIAVADRYLQGTQKKV